MAVELHEDAALPLLRGWVAAVINAAESVYGGQGIYELAMDAIATGWVARYKVECMKLLVIRDDQLQQISNKDLALAYRRTLRAMLEEFNE